MQPLLVYLRALLQPNRDTLLFALRTIAAGLLTLYLAFLFDLEQPKWASMTVVIVSTPLAGMALQKCFSQIVGSIVAGIVAVAITEVFAQAPLPFIVTLALWLALCTAGSALLRYTYSQAFVLSGFTAVIVAMLGQPVPESVYPLAIIRVTETLLGVAGVTFISLLTARPQAVAHGYFAKIDHLLKLIASHAIEAIRGDEEEDAFHRRQMQLLGEISALEGLRRTLYFDAPRLRSADGLVQPLGNQLVLMTSRLALLRQQRRLIMQRMRIPLPESIRLLREEELACLEELARHGRALPAETRRRITRLSQRFDAAAQEAEQLADGLPASLRSLAWALRWEQARLMQQLDEMIELTEAIQEGRPASCYHRQGREHALHLDYALAAANGARAFIALVAAGLIWLETAWDGARAGMILVGILCSLLSTFPRPLQACQNYLRGVLLAMPVAAVYQFLLLPTVNDFEMLALLLVPLLYAIAVGLANLQTAGIAIGFGLSAYLLIGPQNQGNWSNSALQWFEFAGAYLFGTVLAVLVYAWVFPFNAPARLRRLFRQTRAELPGLLRARPIEDNRFAFESRLVDRLASMLGLLPSATDRRSAERFECSLACSSLGVALHQLRRESLDPRGLSDPLRQRLQELLEETAGYLERPDLVQPDGLLEALRAFAERLDALHEAPESGAIAPRALFVTSTGLLVAATLIDRYRSLLAEDIVPPFEEKPLDAR
ncbi:FUSC family protein [Pseudomonas schmalbachii]|uniref:FUSC family protein n=1 Tax=Pseudomonas schmalbachii TaxID=2816993 RepID=A0ABS3TNY0_9PSED|nr:FUSC family protein [Pseudomonas schmalbachii]MBO3275364.1 FUSC family protein [Pseudomonas schmalbachii]